MSESLYKVLEYKSNPTPSDKPIKVKGWALLDIAGKYKLWVTALEKDGSVFCKIASTRVGESYFPALTLPDSEKEKAMMKNITMVVKEKIDTMGVTQKQPEIQFDTPLPF